MRRINNVIRAAIISICSFSAGYNMAEGHKGAASVDVAGILTAAAILRERRPNAEPPKPKVSGLHFGI